MENQNKPVIRKCSYCGNNYELKPGLSNFKNLFRKPSWNEWFILIILVLVMIGSYFYYTDTKTCRETLNNIDEICSKYKTTYITVNASTSSFVPFDLNQVKKQIDNISEKIYETDKKINSIKLVPNGS